MPRKEELVRLFSAAVTDGVKKKNKYVLEHLDGIRALQKLFEKFDRVPENNWILLLIAAVAGPSHPIFQKGYVPPTPEEVMGPLYRQPVVWNGDGYYDNQPTVSENF